VRENAVLQRAEQVDEVRRGIEADEAAWEEELKKPETRN
jgi:hypothetical protein